MIPCPRELHLGESVRRPPTYAVEDVDAARTTSRKVSAHRAVTGQLRRYAAITGPRKLTDLETPFEEKGCKSALPPYNWRDICAALSVSSAAVASTSINCFTMALQFYNIVDKMQPE